MRLETGLHDNVPRDEYDRMASRVNWSTLKLMAKSPAHYRQALLTPPEDSDAKKLGRCAHLAVFEPQRFASEVAMWDMGTRRGKEWEEFKAKHKVREILTENEYEKCQAIGDAARASAMAAPFLSGGRSEVTVIWTHVAKMVGELAGYEVPGRARVDFLANVGAIADLKTTRDASPGGFARQCVEYGYAGQAAWYQDAVFAATGKRLPYVLIAVESAAPWAVQLYEIPGDIMTWGRDQYRTLLDQRQLCVTSNTWPGYSDGPLTLELPRWARPPSDEDATGLRLVIGE